MIKYDNTCSFNCTVTLFAGCEFVTLIFVQRAKECASWPVVVVVSTDVTDRAPFEV